jgi:cell pole-organizing protein PopZ
MTPPTSNEPTLEEILTSIRRIISEDGPATAAASLATSPGWPMAMEIEDDVLVLTQRVTMNGQPFLHDEPAPAPVAEAAAPPALKPEAAPLVETMAAPPAAEPEDYQPTSKSEVSPVVAEDTESQAAAAFEKLDGVAHVETPRGPSILMPAAGRTLEDVIRELMQPLIKEWLDENLAAIVQDRVDEEIERIARRRVR